MHNAIRYNFVANTNLSTNLLLDDLADVMTALGATDLATMASDTAIRDKISAGEVTQRQVPATEFASWFPDGTDLTKSVEITMHVLDEFQWSNHPSQVDSFGNPVQVKGSLIRRLFQVILAASPTGSIDISLMTPMLMAAAIALDDASPIQTIKDGEVAAYSLPSGWIIVTEPVLHPDHRYGATLNG